MDENKEFSEINPEAEKEIAAQEAPETEQQDIFDSIEQPDDAAAEDTAELNESDGLEESESFAGEAEAAPAEKKKPLIMQPIAVAAIIVCVFALAAIVYAVFFNNGITGKWHMMFTYSVMSDAATDDEPDTVDVDYTFEFNSDKTVTATVGTLTSKGTYTYDKNDKGDMVMTLNLIDPATKNAFYSGEFNVTTAGNIFTGKQFVLTVPEATDFAYNFDKKHVDEPKLEVPDGFTRNEKLEGTWIYKDEMMTYTYSFDKDGNASYNVRGTTFNQYTYSASTVDMTFKCKYAPFENYATLVYYFTEPVDMQIGYQFADDNTLIIAGNTFVREGTSTADSAK